MRRAGALPLRRGLQDGRSFAGDWPRSSAGRQSRGNKADASLVGAWQGLHVVALETPINNRRLVWSTISGISVDRGIERNLYWRYVETVRSEQAKVPHRRRPSCSPPVFVACLSRSSHAGRALADLSGARHRLRLRDTLRGQSSQRCWSMRRQPTRTSWTNGSPASREARRLLRTSARSVKPAEGTCLCLTESQGSCRGVEAPNRMALAPRCTQTRLSSSTSQQDSRPRRMSSGPWQPGAGATAKELHCRRGGHGVAVVSPGVWTTSSRWS